MFSGVFQVADDLPFLNSVTISQDGYNVNNSFQQYYNHYHCASIPLYSMNNNEMHTVFFGGIAQYYDDNGTLVQDDNVPFVNTIARVTREADGTMGEYKLPIVMPSLLGTGAEFIPLNNIPQFNNGVLDLDQISSDTTLIGHIFGGISSTDANIFWINNGTQSAATNQIFKVYLIKNNTLSTHELNEQSRGSLNLRVYPNPNDGIFTVSYFLINGGAVRLSLSDINGKIIEEIILQNQDPGENSYTYDLKSSQKRGAYFFSVQTESETAKQKIIVRE
jgi:hypothetical protein